MIKKLIMVKVFQDDKTKWISSNVEFSLGYFKMDKTLLKSIGKELEIVQNTFERWSKEIDPKNLNKGQEHE